MPNMRQEFNDRIRELKAEMAQGPIEILNGPGAGIVIKDAESLHEYARALNDWMFPHHLGSASREHPHDPNRR